MKQQLQSMILSDKGRIKKSAFRKNSDFLKSPVYRWVRDQTMGFLDDDVSPFVRVFCILNGITTTPICLECGEKVSFKRGKGFNKFCSVKCGSKSRITTDKRCKTNQSKYGVDNPSQMPEVRHKVAETMRDRYGIDNGFQLRDRIEAGVREKYGVDNPSQSQIIKERKRRTTQKNYGVDNPMFSEVVKTRIRKTNVDRYGTEWAISAPSIQEKIQKNNVFSSDAFITQRRQKFFERISRRVSNVAPLFDEFHGVQNVYPWKCKVCDTSFEDTLENGKNPRCPSCYPKTISMFEQDVRRFFDDNNVKIVPNCCHLIPPYEVDIYVPQYNLGIECNGAYWHSELGGNRHRRYHLDKTDACRKVGISLIHVWDYEWGDRKTLVQSRLKSQLNLNERIFARKCKVIRLDTETKDRFLDEHHLQYSCPSSVNYGLTYGDELVATMTFGKSRYNKKYEYELLRFCSKINCVVVGGATRLFAAFKRNHQPTTVVSYADRRYSADGNLYDVLGFEYSHDSPPNYQYTNDYRSFHSRIKFQKHKLASLLPNFDEAKTEWENMQLNGYDRIWDCGNSVWVWNKG